MDFVSTGIRKRITHFNGHPSVGYGGPLPIHADDLAHLVDGRVGGHEVVERQLILVVDAADVAAPRDLPEDQPEGIDVRPLERVEVVHVYQLLQYLRQRTKWLIIVTMPRMSSGFSCLKMVLFHAWNDIFVTHYFSARSLDFVAEVLEVLRNCGKLFKPVALNAGVNSSLWSFIICTNQKKGNMTMIKNV